MKKYSGFIKLCLLFIITPIIVWILALQKTVDIYQKGHNLTKVSYVSNQSKKSEKNNILPDDKSPYLSNGKVIHALDTVLNKYHINILSYSPSLLEQQENYGLYYGILILSGHYIGLVKAVNFLEVSKLPIKLLSTSYSTLNSQRNKEKTIELTIIMEQVEQQTKNDTK